VDTFADGVWLVELASLSDNSLVTKAVASALTVPEHPGLPLRETLKRHFQTKVLLLTLDNCEHLLSSCTELTDGLLRACPDLRILATSRERLGIAGELTYSVPQGIIGGADCATVGRSVSPSHGRQSDRFASTSNAAGYDGLELRSPHRARASLVVPRLGVCGRVHA
jgi:predicted ATPase